MEHNQKPIHHSDSYYSHLAHDMRTPLQSLILSLESLELSDALNAEDQSLLLSAKNNADTLNELVLLLDPNLRRKAMAAKSHSVGELVQLVAAKFDSPTIRCSAEILSDFTAFAPDMLAKRLLANLLGNAKKAIASRTDGCGQITLSLRASSPTSGVLTVSDNGCGIPAEQLPHLFTSGFTTTSPDGFQHGQGMGVIAELAAQLGVAISVDSTVGVGTTFSLTFP